MSTSKINAKAQINEIDIIEGVTFSNNVLQKLKNEFVKNRKLTF